VRPASNGPISYFVVASCALSVYRQYCLISTFINFTQVQMQTLRSIEMCSGRAQHATCVAPCRAWGKHSLEERYECSLSKKKDIGSTSSRLQTPSTSHRPALAYPGRNCHTYYHLRTLFKYRIGLAPTHPGSAFCLPVTLPMRQKVGSSTSML
jgi:hypothetical protein